MIAYLDGVVAEVEDEKCTIDVHGVGYSVLSSKKTLKELESRVSGGNPQVRLFTKLIHRDDAMELYGFLNRQEHAFFGLLITVSGIGPRGALKILGASDVSEIAGAVVSENSAFLKSIAGIGEKRAQQIILELKEKIRKLFHLQAVPLVSGYLEAVSLLESLGFSKGESKEAVDGAVKAVGGDGDVEKLVENALRRLSSRK
jgi:holliday junction DNA helicase RuvA